MRTLLDSISLRWLRQLDIRYRLILSLIALSLVPLAVLGVVSYTESSRAIQQKTRVLFIEVVKQAAQSFALQMGQVEAAGEGFMMSDRVQDALVRYYGNDQAERVRARSDLTRTLLEKYGSFDYINQKYLLDNQYNMMDTQVFSQLGDSVVRLAERVRADDRAAWTAYRGSPGQKSIVMLRKIRDKQSSRPAGTLFIGIKASRFSGIFNSVLPGPGASQFVLDLSDGSIVVDATDNPLAGARTAIDPALSVAIGAQALAGHDTDFIGYTGRDRQEYRAAFAHIPNTTWYVVNAIPLKSLMGEPEAMRNRVVLIGLACFGCALLCSLLISRSISAPLSAMVKIMQQTESGNYHLRMPTDGQDEITLLAQRFNAMASRVMEQNEQLEQKVAERTRGLEQAKHALEVLSATDGLTGIANRRSFDTVLVSEIQRAARSQAPLTLMMIDVDLFKNYNDFYGHQAGDQCLRAIASFLQSRSRRSSDLVARYGGEEFAFIGVETDLDSALLLAQSICQEALALGLPHARSPFGNITLSIGVASLVPLPGMTPDALIRMADAAMYNAKNSGRNQACLAQVPIWQS